MANGNGITADQAVTAIKGSGGYVSVIARRLNITQRHVYRVIEKYATAQEVLHEERESQKDYAEGKLQEQIKAGNMTAIIFYLKTQAKDRGYVERQELAGTDGGAILIRVDGVIGDDADAD